MTFASRGFMVGRHEWHRQERRKPFATQSPKSHRKSLHEHALMPKPSPHELAIMRDIYAEIVEAPWFNLNAVTERELLKLIFEARADGIADHAAFADRCRQEAKARFSRRS
jgi:hypothetical protein